jgi:acyl-CoA thioesterase-2
MRVLAPLVAVEPAGVPNRAIGRCLTGALGRIFGGQVAAQAISAAALLRPDADRLPQSLHAHFLRPGDPDQPVTYDLTPLTQGRALTVIRVDASQGQSLILTATVAFHIAEASAQYQDPMPKTTGPEECEVLPYIPQGTNPDVRAPIEFRWPDPRSIRHEPMPATQLTWFRTLEALPDDPVVHAAALAYISDLTLTRTAHQPLHDESFARLGASLDHNIWFQRGFRADEWMLFEQKTVSYFGARSLSHGSIFTPSGELAAFINQEALIRRTPRS